MHRLIGYAVMAALLGLPLQAAAQQPAPPSPQPPSASPPSAPPPPAAGPSVTIASDSIIGTKVRDAQGKDLGEITKLLIDARSGKIASAIIRQGATFGMGGTEISVPWETLSLQRGENQRLVVTLQQPLLDQAPQAQPQAQKEGQQGRSPAASPATGGKTQ
jgi:sporulation protein YlmC with PRC-barrel domain